MIDAEPRCVGRVDGAGSDRPERHFMAKDRAGVRSVGDRRQRLAIVYIRQSAVQRGERQQESTELQHALVDRATQFGWTRETIVVIDDDLGRSGSTMEGRLGFQRLVAEVSRGNVGLVLGVEMWRFQVGEHPQAVGRVHAVAPDF
jgi:Resolvase, N terminal domain